ncbi:MAG: hypothetical protein KAX38_08080 [Candidatus Krumholzibacteria bacterium]|nr:hypothetical protein [Candidatus Krumholzibacteria bacterium]
MAAFDKVIPPGQERQIRVVIKGHQINSGHHRKDFTVTTNDPENSRVELIVEATVPKVFNLSRNLFLTGYSGEDLEGETIISNLLDKPIRITSFRWSERSKDSPKLKDMLKVKIEELERGKKYRLKVKTKKFIEPGRYFSELVLVTDFDELTEKRVSVMLTTYPDVIVHPRNIFLGEMRISEGGSNSFDRKFRIAAARSNSLKVLKVIPSREDITVDIKEIQPGKVYLGKVTVRPTSLVRRYSGSITIYTNHPRYKELVVTISGWVVPGEPKK